MFPPDHSTSKHEVDHIMSHGDKDKVRKGSINETIVVYGAVRVSSSCRADLDSHYRQLSYQLTMKNALQDKFGNCI